MSREYQIVRYKVGKDTFEILTKPGTVLKFKDGKLGFNNVLFADEIFADHQKGQRANEADLITVFKTTNIEEVAKQIIQHGDLQLTSAERKEKVDKKRAEMVNYVHKYYIDPRTKCPHPVLRIENAFAELKITVDPDQPAERQLQEKVLRRLPEVLPIKKSEMAGTLTVPHAVLGQATGVIRKFATISAESYNADGCVMEIAIVPGDYDTFMTELRDITKGDFQFDVAGGAAASTDEAEPEKGKGKRGGKRGGAAGGGGGRGARGGRGRK